MSNISRIVLPLDSHDPDTWRHAFQYARELHHKAELNVKDIVLLVHTKAQLDGTSLSEVLEASKLSAVAKGPLPLGPDKLFCAETPRTLKNLTRRSVLLVCYADLKLLDFADGLINVAGVVVVPAHQGASDVWVTRWDALVHGQSPQAPSALIPDTVVVRALLSVTRMVNLSTNLSNDSDKKIAEETLRILRARGHETPAPNIKSWAIRHNWKPKGADALEALAKKVWSSQEKPSLRSIENANERYASWQTSG